jgi:hypothetical protein
MKKGYTIYKEIAAHILDEDGTELNKLVDVNYFTAREVKKMLEINIDKTINEWVIASQLAEQTDTTYEDTKITIIKEDEIPIATYQIKDFRKQEEK